MANISSLTPPFGIDTLFNWKSWLLPCFLPICIFLVKWTFGQPKPPYPPGPKGFPLIGNVFDIPTSDEYVTYTQWGKKYGDVVHVTALGRHIIILNSATAANELLDQKSAMYSDRPYLAMMHEPDLMDISFAFSLKRYSRAWKRERRVFTQYINPTTVSKNFSYRQISESLRLLNMLLSQPSDIKGTFFHAAARIIIGITYGFDVATLDDPTVTLAQRAMDLGSEGLAPKYIVNTFPAAKYIPAWLPGNKFKALAKETRLIGRRLIEEPFALAAKNINMKVTPSFVQSSMAEFLDTEDPEVKQEIKNVAAQMFAAGVETIAACIQFLTLQLILNPAYQCRAQEELDTIIGHPDSPNFRLPTFEDSLSLPFINALVKETLRWKPPVPTGLPHAALEDDEYRGWSIPKGAIIIGNSFAMLHNENIYSDPHTFKPERFLSTEEKPAEPEPSPAFGFGRRACPGRFLAETTVWIKAACILAAFKLSPPKDEGGNEINLFYAQQAIPGFISHPQAYSCTITPRSSRVEAIIREAEFDKV